MARFDVYPNRDGPGYLLDIQSNLLSPLNTRIVVPLLPPDDAPQPAKRLNPRFRLGPEEVIMATQFMAAVPTAILARPVGSLSDQQGEIVAAVDFLMQGF